MLRLNRCKLTLAVALVNGILAPSAMAIPALEEIVVTAQKREQSLQDTPIAISAFDAAAIEQQGISDVADIGQFTPNVQIAETPAGSTGATIGIRGSVTFNPAIYWEPTVGIYLDGVFLGKNLGGIFDIAELERVEVLRGPQGTLYGKNTVGGAVNLITRKPSGEFSGKVMAGVGNEGYYSVATSIDTPAVELAGGILSANIAALQQERDGIVENIDDPFGSAGAGPRSSSDYKSVNNKVGRLVLNWQAGDMELSYAYDHSKKKNTPTAGQLTDVPAGSALPVDFTGDGTPDFFFPVDGVLSPYLSSDSKQVDHLSNNRSGYEISETRGHALQLSWAAGELGALGEVTFKSITAYREMDWADLIDIDGSPLDFFHSERDVEYDQRSQEFQMVGHTEQTDYVLGLYYFREKGTQYNPITFMAHYGFPTNHNELGIDNTSLAAFGQLDWRPAMFDDRVTLTLGLRWTKEEKVQTIYHPDSMPVIPLTEADKSWTNVSPSFVASWAVRDDINVYGKIANGWKSGGFNGEAQTQALFLQPYDPEQVTSYELGIKSRWSDNRVQVNAALFQNELEDMQFSVFVSGGAAASTVDNAGKASIRGFELELMAQATDNLLLTFNYGYLDPEYKEFIDVDPFTGQSGDFKDVRDFPYAGENTASLGVEYTFGEFAGGELSGRLDWSYQDDYVPYTNPTQNAVSQIEAYDLINARISLSDIPVGEDRSLQVAAWVKNLTDEEYRVNTIPFGLWATSYFGDPRTYGVDLSYHF